MGEVIVVRDEMMRGYHVIITAERIQRSECWLVVSRVDGDLHDATKSDYPEGAADRMLGEITREFE